MTAGGYEPTRDQMTAIVGATRQLYRVTRRWQTLSRLPGFPIDRGNFVALEALFGLERALNPRRLPWDRAGRKSPPTAFWPSEVADGLAWIHNLLDLILQRNHLETLATAADLTSWTAEVEAVPVVISIQDDEVKSLRFILRLLPGPKALPESDPEKASETPPKTEPARLSEVLGKVMEGIPPPVLLLGRGVKPRVLGKPKERLTSAQYLVVMALLEAGETGLGKAELENVCGDAVNVLKRLAKSDPDWGAVIKLAGTKGNKYRINAGEAEPHEGAGSEATADSGTLPEGPSLVW